MYQQSICAYKTGSDKNTWAFLQSSCRKDHIIHRNPLWQEGEHTHHLSIRYGICIDFSWAIEKRKKWQEIETTFFNSLENFASGLREWNSWCFSIQWQKYELMSPCPGLSWKKTLMLLLMMKFYFISFHHCHSWSISRFKLQLINEQQQKIKCFCLLWLSPIHKWTKIQFLLYESLKNIEEE